MAFLYRIAMLEIRNLEITYNSPHNIVLAVDGLNIKLVPGTLNMLAGRNGSGKSSLLRVMAGLQSCQKGEVLINGKTIQDLGDPEIANLVSIMFSMPPQLELTLVKEVVLTAMQRHFSPLKMDFTLEWSHVKHCLEICDMLSFANRDFQTLSDGEKQKVMLARSLAQNTPVLLLDEPLAFLDYPSRKGMLSLLKDLAVKENKVILFSSHDLDISLNHCDTLLVLKSQGKWQFYENAAAFNHLDPMDLFNN